MSLRKHFSKFSPFSHTCNTFRAKEICFLAEKSLILFFSLFILLPCAWFLVFQSRKLQNKISLLLWYTVFREKTTVNKSNAQAQQKLYVTTFQGKCASLQDGLKPESSFTVEGTGNEVPNKIEIIRNLQLIRLLSLRHPLIYTSK